MAELLKHIQIFDGIYEEYKPSACLTSCIKKYYFTEGFKSFFGKTVNAIPKDSVEMIIHYGNGKIEASFFDKIQNIHGKGYILGMQHYNQFQWIKLSTEIKVCSIEFTNVGIKRLFRICPSEILGFIVGIEDILGIRGQNLVDNITNLKNNNERVNYINCYFTGLLKNNNLRQIRSDTLFDLLDKNPFIKIDDLNKELNISRRSIERIYNKEMGMSPKDFFKLVRFNKACELLSKYPNIKISEIVHACEFYDQAHFIHEFKNLANCSPLKYLQKVNGLIYLGRGYIL